MQPSALIEQYASGSNLLADALRDGEGIDIDAHPVPQAWSIREVVCHLADAEIIYADRIKRVLAEDNPTFFEADPNDFIPALHTAARPLDAELQLIAAVRTHMLPILRSLSLDDFQRYGQHSLAGQMSLETLLQRITDHIPHHLKFIRAKIDAS
ncbi:DinB family protein [Planctomycetes bacterium K23_9]|uniref:DinB superfamily protein n=1 Tax=Stieleria marina TaxID=1930275 RepID=A0A517NVQ4_9BACT|nr:DinB superfamily protein [Planctomycetes bacterium K23_9]